MKTILSLIIASVLGFQATSLAQTITPMGSESGSAGTITPIGSGVSSGTITPVKINSQTGTKSPKTPSPKTLLPAQVECKTLDLSKGDIRYFRETNQEPYSQIVSINSAFKGIANSDFGGSDGSKRYFDIELNRDFGLSGKTNPNGSESKMRTLVTHGLGALIVDTSVDHFFQAQPGMTIKPTRYVLFKYNINGKWGKFYSGRAEICVK
jgi:hypothetical protein